MFRNRFSHLRLAAVTAFLLAVAVGTSAGVAAQSPAPADSPSPPDSPFAYAGAVFDAWLNDDAATIIHLSEPSAAQLLLAWAPGEETWSGPPLCEGAAGSTYCSWTSESSQLLLRVANEAAAQGEAHAVTEAAFIPTVDGVAIWPFSTQEAADNTQSSVDEGHSPWMVDPAAVGLSFAGAVFDWEAPIFEATDDPARFHLVDSATGVVVDVELAQPAREGAGGIWAVVRTGPPHAEGTTPVASLTPVSSPTAVAKPPSATAAAAGSSVTMGTGTYCWSTPAAPGLCRDMSGPVTGTQALVVQRGETIVVTTQFPGTNITEASANAYDVNTMQGAPAGPGELAWNLRPIGGQPLDSTTTATGLEFAADLTPGRYVVSVFLKVPEGDVSYGVVLDVR